MYMEDDWFGDYGVDVNILDLIEEEIQKSLPLDKNSEPM
jgi:hypothetical protein